MRRILHLSSSESRTHIGERILTALRAAHLEVTTRDTMVLPIEVGGYRIVVTDEASLPPLEWQLASGLRETSSTLYVLTAPGIEIPGIVRAKEILDQYSVGILYSDTIEALVRVVSDAASPPVTSAPR